jgi:hypothetical protein
MGRDLGGKVVHHFVQKNRYNITSLFSLITIPVSHEHVTEYVNII